jgi:hypothetical protein
MYHRSVGIPSIITLSLMGRFGHGGILSFSGADVVDFVF